MESLKVFVITAYPVNYKMQSPMPCKNLIARAVMKKIWLFSIYVIAPSPAVQLVVITSPISIAFFDPKKFFSHELKGAKMICAT